MRSARSHLGNALQKFEELHSAATIQSVLTALPVAHELQPHLTALPSQQFTACEVAFEDVRKATGIASWAAVHSRSSNLRTCLLKSWTQHSRTLDEASLPAMPEDKGPRESACVKYGFCVCSSAGKDIFRMRNRVLEFLKLNFPRGHKEARRLLIDGHICLQLTGVAGPDKKAAPWTKLAGELLDEDETAEVVSGELWWHIGSQFLRPYRPHHADPEESRRQARWNCCAETDRRVVHGPTGLSAAVQGQQVGPQCLSDGGISRACHGVQSC